MNWPDFWAGLLPPSPPQQRVQFYWDAEIQCTVLHTQRERTIYHLLFEVQQIPNCILGTV